jgi:hypothetical protein
MSGILGPQTFSYLPLSAMNKVSLVTAVKAIEGANNDYTVLRGHVITIAEVGGRKAMDASNGGALAINAESWYTYSDTIANSATSAATLIGARYASLNTIFTLM